MATRYALNTTTAILSVTGTALKTASEVSGTARSPSPGGPTLLVLRFTRAGGSTATGAVFRLYGRNADSEAWKLLPVRVVTSSTSRIVTALSATVSASAGTTVEDAIEVPDLPYFAQWKATVQTTGTDGVAGDTASIPSGAWLV